MSASERPRYAVHRMSEEVGLVGAVLDGRYRVDRVIGAGGFGTVYEGLHLTLGQPVAIKLFRIADDTSSARRAELLAGFVEEARLLTKLRHDNIVRMLDQGFVNVAGSASGSPYAVMEYCPHGSLRDLLAARGTRLPLAEALELVKGIVAGMRHAHENGIAHRDLKPGNVMLDKLADGRLVPRIIDFGIAKLIEEGDVAGSGATRTRSTAISFTPAYAAPEQAIGGRTGMWTDVHAIGLIFCELLTGAPPYGRDDMSLKIIDPVRPTPAAAGVDAGPFEPVIRRALAIRPDERYADAIALEHALADAERDLRLGDTIRQSPPSTAAAPQSRRWLLGAGITAALAASGFALWRRANANDDETAPSDSASAPASATPPSSAPAASASPALVKASPGLAALTAGQIVERMLAAGLAPVTRPAPDAATQQLMIPFTQASSTGAVYMNALTLPDVPVAAQAMVTLMNVRAWVALDRKEGYELAYVVDKNCVLSMTWTPKPGEAALAVFTKLAEELAFDIRGCSWMGSDPSSDAKLTKPLWCAKRITDLTPTELVLRLEAVGAVLDVKVPMPELQTLLVRRGVRGELAFFPSAGAAENAKAQALAERLRNQKKPFFIASEGGAAIVGQGPLVDVAFMDEALEGLGASVTKG